MKIFGEDNFFNKEMAKLYKAQDEVYFNEMSMTIKTYMPTIVFDREKLEKWVRLCIRLDDIDNTDLIDMATAKKFQELKEKLSLTEKALELACEAVDCDVCPLYETICTEGGCSKALAKCYLEEAKEMMQSE